jgi:hypothetical protein
VSYLLPTRLPIGNYIPAVPAQPGGQAEHAAGLQQGSTLQIPADIKIPLTGDDLGELSQEEYNLEQSGAISLGFSVFNLAPSGTHDVLIFQVSRYKDVADQDDTFRFGVAVEATITVTTEKFQGGLTLPAVAANVQLSNATASSTLAVRGYLPKAPLELPAWGSFDVGSYTDFQNTVSQLQKSVLFDNKNIQPVLLATTKTAPGAEPAQERPHGFFYDMGQRIKQNL